MRRSDLSESGINIKERRKTNAKLKKKLTIVGVACFVAFCLLIELLGHIPGLAFNGWVDVFSWIGLPQPSVIAEDELQVHFIDVGNADCILVRQGDHNLLIDAAENTRAKWLVDYLDRHGIEKLDLVVLTHPHSDHMGSMEAMVERFAVDRFIMSYMPEGEEPTSVAYISMLEALQRHNITVEEAKSGTLYPLGKAELQIIAPLPLDKPIEDANQISVVTRLTYGEHAFLFTGDAEMDLEGQMVASRLDLRADVLEVAHHGSKTSTSPAFLRAVSPKYAVIPCGKNDYGHPNTDVVNRLSDMGAQVYRTDVHGDIVFTSDGRKLSVKYSRGD